MVDFEESGVDQKTLNDLKDVSLHLLRVSWRIQMEYGVVIQVRPKAGGTAVLREAVLMGEHRLLRLPLYAAAATRFGLGCQAIIVHPMSLSTTSMLITYA